MKRARVILSQSTEQTLLAWAQSREPQGPRPTLEEAATLALDEFAREHRALIERLADAMQVEEIGRRWERR